jgi:hypothetical protein
MGIVMNLTGSYKIFCSGPKEGKYAYHPERR